MAYKKKVGMIQVIFTGYTMMWLDAVNVKSGQAITVFLKYKMTEAMKKALDSQIERASHTFIMCSKREEPNYYNFLGFRSKWQSLGMQRKAERIMAYEALEHEVNVDYNPVRSGARQHSSKGFVGLPTNQRTGNKVTRALANRIDNSAEIARKRAEFKKDRVKRAEKKLLIKLRKKHFFDRNPHIHTTDAQWDDYLLKNHRHEFETQLEKKARYHVELAEAGLL